jgi:hypothetical protein
MDTADQVALDFGNRTKIRVPYHPVGAPLPGRSISLSAWLLMRAELCATIGME